MTAERPRFERLDLDHAIHVLADYISRPTAERKRGALAHAHLEVASALRDLVRAVVRESARQVREGGPQ